MVDVARVNPRSYDSKLPYAVWLRVELGKQGIQFTGGPLSAWYRPLEDIIARPYSVSTDWDGSLVVCQKRS